jgi:hypothetical protein
LRVAGPLSRASWRPEEIVRPSRRRLGLGAPCLVVDAVRDAVADEVELGPVLEPRLQAGEHKHEACGVRKPSSPAAVVIE